MIDRRKLPYRETSDVFILTKKGVVARDTGNYISVPGGGVDAGETVLKAVERECKEEVGVTGLSFHHISTVEWDWYPEWTENKPKRIDRYAKFRGEKIYMYIAFETAKTKYTEPNDPDGDSPFSRGSSRGWAPTTLSPSALLRIHDRYSLKEHPNTLQYRSMQRAIISMLIAVNKLPTRYVRA